MESTLRDAILEIGALMDGGRLPEESLKWGQPTFGVRSRPSP